MIVDKLMDCLDHQSHSLAEVPDAEIITIAVVAAKYFSVIASRDGKCFWGVAAFLTCHSVVFIILTFFLPPKMDYAGSPAFPLTRLYINRGELCKGSAWLRHSWRVYQ
jgi:hypothetical protein